MGGLLAGNSGQADDAVRVGVTAEAMVVLGLIRPSVAKQASEGDVERVFGPLRVAVE